MKSRALIPLWLVVIATTIAFTALRFLDLYGRRDTLDFFALSSLGVTTSTLGLLTRRRHPSFASVGVRT